MVSQGSWEKGEPRGRAIEKRMAKEQLPAKETQEESRGRERSAGRLRKKGHQWAEAVPIGFILG